MPFFLSLPAILPLPHPYLTAASGLISFSRLLDQAVGRADRYWLGQLQALGVILEDGGRSLWAASTRAGSLDPLHANQVRQLIRPIETAMLEIDKLHSEMVGDRRSLNIGERTEMQVLRMSSYRNDLHRCGWDLLTTSQERQEAPPVIPERYRRDRYQMGPLVPDLDDSAVHVWFLYRETHRATFLPRVRLAEALPTPDVEIDAAPASDGSLTELQWLREEWIEKYFDARAENRNVVARRLRKGERVGVLDLMKLVWGAGVVEDHYEDRWKKLHRRTNDDLASIREDEPAFPFLYKIEQLDRACRLRIVNEPL